MDQLIREFIGIFTVEKTVYNELLRLAKLKKDVLINNQVDELNKIVAKEKEANKKVYSLEKRRETAIKKIADSCGKDIKDVNLGSVIDMCDGTLKTQLVSLKNSFTVLLKELVDSNDINKDLIKTQLDYTSFCLDVMTQCTDTSDTYNDAGSMNDESRQRIGIIDQKV